MTGGTAAASQLRNRVSAHHPFPAGQERGYINTIFTRCRVQRRDWGGLSPASDRGDDMRTNAGKKKEKCKNCEGKGTLKKGDKVVRCQRCDGTGIKR
jgi:hypothetical protein